MLFGPPTGSRGQVDRATPEPARPLPPHRQIRPLRLSQIRLPSPDVSHLTPLRSHRLFHANLCRLRVQDIRANGQTAPNMNQSSSSLRMGNRGQFCSFPSAVLSSQIRRGGLAFSPHIRRTTANDATAWSTHGHSSGENCEICGLGAPFDFPPQCGGFRSLSGGAVCFAAATTNWFRTLSQNPTNS